MGPSATSLTPGLVKVLYDHPEGFDPPVAKTNDHIRRGECHDFTTVEAKAGDVLLLHGLLPHTNSYKLPSLRTGHLQPARVSPLAVQPEPSRWRLREYSTATPLTADPV